MKRGGWLLVLGVVVVAFLFRATSGFDGPRAGDTVTPVLSQPVAWTAGEAADLYVRLQAEGADGAKRPLGFGGIRRDPLATVVFYEGDDKVNSQEVRLSHRC